MDEEDFGFQVDDGFEEFSEPATSKTDVDLTTEGVDSVSSQSEKNDLGDEEEKTSTEQDTARGKDLVKQSDDVRLERSGWLRMLEPKKTLSRRPNRKERWFSLSNGLLTYASTVTADPAASFNVSDITSVMEVPEAPESFTVMVGSKTLNLTARDENDAKSWVASLRKAQKSITTSDSFGAATGSALLF
eukprot:gene7569-7707_t